MEDLLYTMTRESHALQELRKDIQGIWVDTAARELNGRYLNPHESEDQQMLAALNNQKNNLDQTKIKLDSAQTCAQQAARHAEEVIDNLQSAEQELAKVRNDYDRYKQYDSEARSNLPIIQGWIDRANDACPEEPPSPESYIQRLGAEPSLELLGAGIKIAPAHTLSEHSPEVEEEELRQAVQDQNRGTKTKFTSSREMGMAIKETWEENETNMRKFASSHAGGVQVPNQTYYGPRVNYAGYKKLASGEIRRISGQAPVVIVVKFDGWGGYGLQTAYPYAKFS
jgi:hypothetical protein